MSKYLSYLITAALILSPLALKAESIENTKAAAESQAQLEKSHKIINKLDKEIAEIKGTPQKRAEKTANLIIETINSKNVDVKTATLILVHTEKTYPEANKHVIKIAQSGKASEKLSQAVEKSAAASTSATDSSAPASSESAPAAAIDGAQNPTSNDSTQNKPSGTTAGPGSADTMVREKEENSISNFTEKEVPPSSH